MTYEEYRGIRGLVAAELLTDTTETTGLTYGTPFTVAGVAELSKETETSSETHYYDNVPAIVIDSVGADTVTCTCAAVPLSVVAKLTGQTYDDATGCFIEEQGTAKYYAIGYITEDTSGNEVFVWRLKVRCSIPSSTHGTKNDGTDANGQELTFTGIPTIHKFTATGKAAKAVNLETSLGLTTYTETSFFASVQNPDLVADSVTPVTPDTP